MYFLWSLSRLLLDVTNPTVFVGFIGGIIAVSSLYS